MKNFVIFSLQHSKKDLDSFYEEKFHIFCKEMYFLINFSLQILLTFLLWNFLRSMVRTFFDVFLEMPVNSGF